MGQPEPELDSSHNLCVQTSLYLKNPLPNQALMEKGGVGSGHLYNLTYGDPYAQGDLRKHLGHILEYRSQTPALLTKRN